VAQNVASFLVARRKQAPKPSVLVMANVEAFFANEPVEVSPENATEPVLEETLQVIEGPTPTTSILGQPLGSNIQHILEDIELELEDSIGMGSNNLGRSAAERVVAKTPTQPLSPILEVGATSCAETTKRPRHLAPIKVDKALGSKRPRASEAYDSEAFDSKGSIEIRPSGANWTIGRQLARVGGDLKGNPFKAMVDLIPHEDMKMECDAFVRGMAENMLHFQYA
jgi:hypothetical protein